MRARSVAKQWVRYVVLWSQLREFTRTLSTPPRRLSLQSRAELACGKRRTASMNPCAMPVNWEGEDKSRYFWQLAQWRWHFISWSMILRVWESTLHIVHHQECWSPISTWLYSKTPNWFGIYTLFQAANSSYKAHLPLIPGKLLERSFSLYTRHSFPRGPPRGCLWQWTFLNRSLFITCSRTNTTNVNNNFQLPLKTASTFWAQMLRRQHSKQYCIKI